MNERGFDARLDRRRLLGLTVEAAGAVTALSIAPALAAVALAAPDRMSFYPLPNGYRGIHWSADYGSNYGGNDDSEMPYKALEKVIRPTKCSWVKAVFLPESVHKKVGLRFGQIMKLNGIEPIMRDYRQFSASTPISAEHFDGILEGIKAFNLHYWQLFPEPNNKVQWERRMIPPMREAVDQVMRLWVPPAQRIIEAGGYPSLPDPCPGGDRNDRDFFRGMFEWLKANNLLDIFDPLKHNGCSAVIGIQLYSGRTDEQRNSDGTVKFGTDDDGIKYDGFNKHSVYNKISREYVPFDIPILSMEGGVDVTVPIDLNVKDSPRVPNPAFKDVYMAIARIQSSSARPSYLLSTADYLAVPNLDERRTWHEYALFTEKLDPAIPAVAQVQDELTHIVMR